MKTFKTLFLFIITSLLFSCSKSTNNNPNPIPETFTFSINQSVSNILELDDVTFSVSSSNINANITKIVWLVNNVQISNSNPSIFTLTKAFSSAGTYAIKAVIYYNTSIATIEKSIVVNERPKSLVTFKNVEILSYFYDNEYYNSLYSFYKMKAKFEITELNAAGNDEIKVYSLENSQNWALNNFMIYPITWDISIADYKAKVYETGNFYPNNQGSYNSAITFYTAKSVGGIQQPYTIIKIAKIDLNPYRIQKPNTVDITYLDMKIRLTLQWN